MYYRSIMEEKIGPVLYRSGSPEHAADSKMQVTA